MTLRAPKMARSLARETIQPGEVLHTAEGVPQIVYFRPGEASHPLVVFLPGGGHMARVAYGHRGARPQDFLDFWLAQRAWGLLALSYPSDHPAFPTHYPDLSIADWAASCAEIVRRHIAEDVDRDVAVVGWSGAGRSIVAITRALTARGIHPICFVSLAATAPLPNLFPHPVSVERFTTAGFWDARTRQRQWLQQMERQVDASGCPAVSADAYLAHYVVNSPFTLRGQAREGATTLCEESLADQLGAFTYVDYPMIAAIVPEDATDPLHALTDHAMWGALNVQRIARRVPIGAVANWQALRELVRGVPQRLSRTVPGGHFFFIGEPGAQQTASHIVELVRDVRQLDELLAALTRPDRSPSTHSR